MKDSLRTGFRSLWSDRDIRVIVPARSLSVLGDSITLVVLLLSVADTAQPLRASVLLAAFALPLFVAAPIAGRIVDGYDSRVVLVCAGTLQVLASLGVVFSTGFELTVGWVVVLQAGQAVSLPAWSALVPRVVGEERVGKALGLMQSLGAGAGLAGSAAAGVLYEVLGYRGTLALDTATFALLAVAGALVRTRRGRRYDGASRADGPTAADGGLGASGGWGYVRRDVLLRVLVPALGMLVLCLEATNVVEVFLVRNAMRASAQMYGVATAVFMLGTIGGPILAGRVANDRSRIGHAAVASAVAGLMIIAVGSSPTVWFVLPAMLGLGAGAGALNALLGAVLLTRPPENMRGRVMATLNGTLRGCSVLAMLLGGIGGQLVGPRATFVVAGTLSLGVATLVLRSRRALDLAPTRAGADTLQV